MFFIRQGATHKVVLGPAVAVGDGFTPVTNLDVATADEAEAILHDNGTVVDISGYTWAAIATADGYYHLTLQAAISGTVGHLTIVVNDDNLILPLRADFTVLDTAAYDANFKDAATGPALATDVTTAHSTTDGKVDAIPTTAMRGTDNAPTKTQMDAAHALLATPAEVNAQVLDTLATDTPIDGKSIVAALRYLSAVIAGLLPSGAGGETETFKGLDGSTDRVQFTVDDDGNRTAVSYDP